ncbi:FCGBP protein, partial [Heliornis fulica]|nr:FCGBP protein [Heliornis fulica]
SPPQLGLTCPPNQHYELCGPSCPPTCLGQSEAEACEGPSRCSEGCFCSQGFLRSGGHCVPLPHCGCVHEGLYYQAGAEFYTHPLCALRCSCEGGGKVTCHPGGCAGGLACAVRDGVRGCYPEDCGRCQVLGEVSSSTFDGRPVFFDGTCAHTTLAEAVAGGDGEDEVVPFVVEMEKESGKDGRSLRKLVVTVRGVAIALAEGTQWEVAVDGERHLLPLTLAGGSVTVSQEGTHRVLRVRGGPKLLYDGDSYVLLTLPGVYRRRTRGLCGNFNGDAGDD